MTALIKRLKLLCVFLFVLLFPCSHVFAQTIQYKSLFKIAPADTSIVMLQRIFGHVGTSLAGETGLLKVMFRTFNNAMFALVIILVMYTVLISIVNTAIQGEFLGKKLQSPWIPMRTVGSLILVLPTASGYSMIQIFMMWVITQGVGAADVLWETVIKYLAVEGGTLIAPAPTFDLQFGNDATGFVKGLICMHRKYRSLEGGVGKTSADIIDTVQPVCENGICFFRDRYFSKEKYNIPIYEDNPYDECGGVVWKTPRPKEATEDALRSLASGLSDINNSFTWLPNVQDVDLDFSSVGSWLSGAVSDVGSFITGKDKVSENKMKQLAAKYEALDTAVLENITELNTAIILYTSAEDRDAGKELLASANINPIEMFRDKIVAQIQARTLEVALSLHKGEDESKWQQAIDHGWANAGAYYQIIAGSTAVEDALQSEPDDVVFSSIEVGDDGPVIEYWKSNSLRALVPSELPSISEAGTSTGGGENIITFILNKSLDPIIDFFSKDILGIGSNPYDPTNPAFSGQTNPVTQIQSMGNRIVKATATAWGIGIADRNLCTLIHHLKLLKDGISHRFNDLETMLMRPIVTVYNISTKTNTLFKEETQETKNVSQSNSNSTQIYIENKQPL